jgi:signal peptidase I
MLKSEAIAEPKTDQPAPETETLLESIASICTVLAVGLFVMAFIFQNFEIPSASMEKTLLIGDHVVVDRTTFSPPSHWMPLVHYRAPRRGDIIVFLKPHPESPDLYLVKRVVGLPGDRIHLRSGILYVNGVAQHEPQISMPDDTHPYDSARDDFPSDLPGIQQEASANNAALWAEDLPNHIVNGELVVPPGTVFAMGDNRVESLDGRFWGFVPLQNIIGRPLFVYWSFETPSDEMYKQTVADRIGFFIHIVTHFATQTRWKRTFHLTR